MTTSSDARYQALAVRAAAAIGTSSPDVIRAILAQWSCEVGGGAPWPVPRNNPGNISKCAVVAGIPYTVGLGAPNGPNCPIVTFPTPETGADAYAAAIATIPRYRTALLDARAGNGAAFLQAITLSGYGTSLSCASGVYRANGGTAIAPNATLASYNAPGPVSQQALDYLDAHIKPQIGRLSWWGAMLANGAGGFFADSTITGEILSTIDGLGIDYNATITQADYDATVKFFKTQGSTKDQLGADPLGLGAAVNGLVKGMGGALQGLLWLGALLAIVLMGLYLALAPSGGEA